MHSYPQMLLLKAMAITNFCVPFRNILHTYVQIPIILSPYFYINETILHIHHSVPCLFLLTIHVERLSLSAAHEEPFLGNHCISIP